MSRTRQPPLVTGISPNEGIPWTKVTIRGENLGTGPADLIGKGRDDAVCSWWMHFYVGQLRQDILFWNSEGDRKTPLRSVQDDLNRNERIIWFSDFSVKIIILSDLACIVFHLVIEKAPHSRGLPPFLGVGLSCQDCQNSRPALLASPHTAVCSSQVPGELGLFCSLLLSEPNLNSLHPEEPVRSAGPHRGTCGHLSTPDAHCGGSTEPPNLTATGSLQTHARPRFALGSPNVYIFRASYVLVFRISLCCLSL